MNDAPTDVQPNDAGPGTRVRTGRVRLAVWIALSAAFVAFLALGSVNARIWRFGELHVEPKAIRQIWQVQATDLNDVSNAWPLQALYYGSLLIFVAGVILGMRYLLAESPEEALDITREES
jgi:hypothetical protein